VFVVGPDCASPAPRSFKTLVVALDGTDAAEASLGLAAAWAHSLRLGVTVVQVLEPSRPLAGLPPGDVLEAGYIESMAHGLRNQGIDSSWEVLHAGRRHVVDALVEYLSGQEGAVLVLTPTTKPGDAPVLGRVTRRALYHSPVPVLVARAYL
jgi:nucleotide-binding universal stress UspA family protein